MTPDLTPHPISHSFFARTAPLPKNQAEELSRLVVAAGEEVTAGAARRAKLRSAASAAVRVLELDDADVGPELATLLNQVFVFDFVRVCPLSVLSVCLAGFCPPTHPGDAWPTPILAFTTAWGKLCRSLEPS